MHDATIPVVLFVYARPDHLTRTLASLRANKVPLLYVYCDGAKHATDAERVMETRSVVRGIDWCQTRIIERDANLGLGASILKGVGEVLRQHDSLIVFEDDLICVPGTYAYLSAALRRYRDDSRVMSVTGWTHPRITPANVGLQPYFDGRAECWVWGTWARVWSGMADDATTLLARYEGRGMDPYRYGADIPGMAAIEHVRNIWAVRLLALHLNAGGVCLRPPYSMVEHIGFDSLATNAGEANEWANPPLRSVPPVPDHWPMVAEHPDCVRLWQAACGRRPRPEGRLRKLLRGATRRMRALRRRMQ